MSEKVCTGQVIIVTGANSGVGLETTRQLIAQGANVVMACTNKESASETAKQFDGLKGSYDVMQFNLGDLKTVRQLAKQFVSKYDKLDGLVCNAGAVFQGERKTTKDGFELTIGVNFLGHFLLAELLLDKLKHSAPSRMLIVSSVVHAGSPKKRPQIQLDDLQYEKRSYNAMDAYAEAKLADVLYVKELAERLEGTDVAVFSVHPGWARSNFGRNTDNVFLKGLMSALNPLFKWMRMSDSSEEAAQTSLHVMISDEAPKHSGAYFSQSSVLYRDKEAKKGGWPMKSPNPNAHDMDTAHKLVAQSRKLVGLDK
jgi:light-dependent protochlorophyllide reductase